MGAWKSLSTNFKNTLAIFADVFWLYRGLNQIILLFLLIIFLLVSTVESLKVISVLKPHLLTLEFQIEGEVGIDRGAGKFRSE